MMFPLQLFSVNMSPAVPTKGALDGSEEMLQLVQFA